MIVPGNIRERPRVLDRVALGGQISYEMILMGNESDDIVKLALSRYKKTNWNGVDLLQLKDRCAIVRQELDIMKRLLKLPGNHEIYDSH